MSVVFSPNMNLPIPGVGTEPGPDYAYDVNSALTLVDGHDHTPGNGVQITPSAININSALSMQNHLLQNIAGLTLTAQGSLPAVNTIYEAGNDLYFVDGLGNNVRITQSGGIAGTPGSIANLTSPASASYVSVSSTFVLQSGASIAANLDIGAVRLRNLTPNSTFALTLQPVANLGSDYAITLPVLPSVQSFVTLDNTGAMAAPIAFNQGITGANIAPTTIDATKFVVGTQTPNVVTSVSTTYSAVASDGLILAGGGGNYNINLYQASANVGLTLKIKNVSGGYIGVVPFGSENIDGMASFLLTGLYSVLTLVSIGSGWAIVDFDSAAEFRQTVIPPTPTAVSVGPIWHALSGNVLVLPAGTWRLSSSVSVYTTNNTSATINAGYFGSNGNNTTSLPAAVTGLSAVLAGSISAPVQIADVFGASITYGTFAMPASVVVIPPGGSSTIYLNILSSSTGFSVGQAGLFVAERLR